MCDPINFYFFFLIPLVQFFITFISFSLFFSGSIFLFFIFILFLLPHKSMEKGQHHREQQLTPENFFNVKRYESFNDSSSSSSSSLSSFNDSSSSSSLSASSSSSSSSSSWSSRSFLSSSSSIAVSDEEQDSRFLDRYEMFISVVPHVSNKWDENYLGQIHNFICLRCGIQHTGYIITTCTYDKNATTYDKSDNQEKNSTGEKVESKQKDTKDKDYILGHNKIKSEKTKQKWPPQYGQFCSLSCRDDFVFRQDGFNLADVIVQNRLMNKSVYGVTEIVKCAPAVERLPHFCASNQYTLTLDQYKQKLTYPKHGPDPSKHSLVIEPLFQVVKLVTWPGSDESRKESESTPGAAIPKMSSTSSSSSSTLLKHKSELKCSAEKNQIKKQNEPNIEFAVSLDQHYPFAKEDNIIKERESDM